MEPALVYYSDRGARVVVCLPARFALSEKSILENHRGARATRFRARPALWQYFLHFASVILGAALIAAAIVYRKFVSGAADGFPWYCIYLVCASLIPSAGFFYTARSFINWRAFSFTFFLLLLISLLWEVTLALPYGW